MWQPIETAPIGKFILLWWTPITPNKYAEAAVIGDISAYEHGKYWGHDGKYHDLSRVTHWMEIPEPPVIKGDTK